MKIDFEKGNGLVPVIIQHAHSSEVLMLGYMNNEAFEKSKEIGKVTFFSRSKQRLWTKGETSGNYLEIQDMQVDCDNDTLLIQAIPHGPVCHTGTDTCFNLSSNRGFVGQLDQTIQAYKLNPHESSYTSSLFAKGIDRISQKVGEEAVELVIASKNEDKERVISEGADLVYHALVLLAEKDLSWVDIENELARRKK